MKKQILSILLTLCMVLCLVPITASAIEIYIDLTIVGQANLTLEVVSGALTMSRKKFGIKRAFLPMRKDCFLAKKSLRTGARWQITIFRRKARCACVCKGRYSLAQMH